MAKVRNKIQFSTKYGMSSFVTYDNLDPSKEHFALIFKDADKQECPLVRVHSECITGDLFGSCKCDCGDQLHEALTRFKETGGILLYLRQEGRGIGLYNKLDAYTLQQQGYDTFQANCKLNLPEDMREYGIAAEMLKVLRIKKIDLLSNNPDKHLQLQKNGIHIRKRLSTELYLKRDNQKYLRAKIEKTGHQFANNLLSFQ